MHVPLKVFQVLVQILGHMKSLSWNKTIANSLLFYAKMQEI